MYNVINLKNNTFSFEGVEEDKRMAFKTLYFLMTTRRKCFNSNNLEIVRKSLKFCMKNIKMFKKN